MFTKNTLTIITLLAALLTMGITMSLTQEGSTTSKDTVQEQSKESSPALSLKDKVYRDLSPEAKAIVDKWGLSPFAMRNTDIVWTNHADRVDWLQEGNSFHRKGCPVAPGNQTPVRLEVAEDHGYIPCNICRPNLGR